VAIDTDSLKALLQATLNAVYNFIESSDKKALSRLN
jgi:hypothetical protein